MSNVAALTRPENFRPSKGKPEPMRAPKTAAQATANLIIIVTALILLGAVAGGFILYSWL